MQNNPQNRDLEYWSREWGKTEMDFSACEDFWNSRALTFNENVVSKEKMTEIMIGGLKEKGMMNHGSRVLDIGCGPGTHAIPMARKVSQVTAIDIAQNMLDHLDCRAGELELDNIVTQKVNWVDIDLAQMQWEKAFDLVFASMSPAIHNYETLKKMCDASRGWCYLSAWVRRENKIEDALLDVIRKKDEDSGILEGKIYYVFNILWNLGYHPEVTYTERKWSGVQDVEEALESYTKKLMILNKLTEEDHQKIKKRLYEFEKNGKVEEESNAIVGTVIWKTSLA